MTSAFELFKIGIGPSSSHTVGPMMAAARFRDGLGANAARIRVELFGSLAWTGVGHSTDLAIALGLLGYRPTTVDPDAIPVLIDALRKSCWIPLGDGSYGVVYQPDVDLVLNKNDLLPLHSNGMRFRALGGDDRIVAEEILYSVGGGFVVGEDGGSSENPQPASLPFETARDLLEVCDRTGLTIAEVQYANELALRNSHTIDSGLDEICGAMFSCIERGLRQEGELPGSLRVRRRAKHLHERLVGGSVSNLWRPHEAMDWISLFALAVNEENASGGRVVTAPTNGAAGIIPAVLRYCRDFYPDWSAARGREFLLVAAAIGGLIKRRASISGAEVGCQGEVGSAAAMAAAGLASVLGGTPSQIENAAEIAMEHHLGLTCDPVGGLVQIPCIERNALGANKAVASASLALHGDGYHKVSLDYVIETMRQTGHDMLSKYKETSLGGLAVNVTAC